MDYVYFHEKLEVSVLVENLSRYYGSQKAVDSLSFQVNKGEILGFLGPNGAGKSTTMKMITGYLPPDEGKILVAGFDPSKPGLESRKKIGYLPENNPLYLDMYVIEYLAFVADIHRLHDVKKAISEVIGMTGLETEKHKKISSLSRGYRQRVGLAQALIHDPEILILDEPTSGLDPNQLTEIRALIRKLGENKTVIFSTHIMQEVEAVCDRVLILNKGKKVADSKVTELLAGEKDSETYIAEFETQVNINLILSLQGVLAVEKLEANAIRIKALKDSDVRQQVFKLAVDLNLVLLGMRKQENSLEDIFNKLTS